MRVLLVEDEADLGASIKRVLNHADYIVDWVQDGNDAWKYLETNGMEYTLGIFDWLLPGISGLELLRRLRQQHNPLPIMLLTAKDSMEDKVIGLDAGADDYLVKPFGIAELLARLRALQRRVPQLQPQQLRLANLTLDYSTNSVWLHDANGNQQVIVLTRKEFQLLEYFMQHPQQILRTDQLLDRLWELGAEPMSNVVAAQVRLLRRKLSNFGSDVIIETVYGLGYRLRLNP